LPDIHSGLSPTFYQLHLIYGDSSGPSIRNVTGSNELIKDHIVTMFAGTFRIGKFYRFLTIILFKQHAVFQVGQVTSLMIRIIRQVRISSEVVALS
jgi:hypothetical protein